eukprot:5371940-Amphidinium_carterae.1
MEKTSWQSKALRGETAFVLGRSFRFTLAIAISVLTACSCTWRTNGTTMITMGGIGGLACRLLPLQSFPLEPRIAKPPKSPPNKLAKQIGKMGGVGGFASQEMHPIPIPKAYIDRQDSRQLQMAKVLKRRLLLNMWVDIE